MRRHCRFHVAVDGEDETTNSTTDGSPAVIVLARSSRAIEICKETTPWLELLGL